MNDQIRTTMHRIRSEFSTLYTILQCAEEDNTSTQIKELIREAMKRKPQMEENLTRIHELAISKE